jgi:hypothetical protein
MMPSEPAGSHVVQLIPHDDNMRAYCGRYKGDWWLRLNLAKLKYPDTGKTALFNIERMYKDSLSSQTAKMRGRFLAKYP